MVLTFEKQPNPIDALMSFARPVKPGLKDQLGNFLVHNKKNILEILLKLSFSAVGVAISFYITRWLMRKMDPTYEEKKRAQLETKKFLENIGAEKLSLNEYEILMASNFVRPSDIDCTWDSIGGLDDVVNDIRENVVYPLKSIALKQTRSKLLKSPKGVLLYGPPGTGKTTIAKALARESGAHFLNIEVSTLFDKWYGESQKRTAAIFSLAKKIQPIIIFIDEIDSFLRMRQQFDHESTSMMKTQFMSDWDGLFANESNQILVIGATNRPSDVDAAILRRLPLKFRIGVPDKEQRKKILEIILREETLDDDVDLSVIAEKSAGMTGSDLKELCRYAALNRFVTQMKNENTENKIFEEFAAEYDNNEDYDKFQKLQNVDFDIAFQKFNKAKDYLKGCLHEPECD